MVIRFSSWQDIPQLAPFVNECKMRKKRRSCDY